MIGYRHLWPIVRHLPPEFAHTIGLQLLRIPIRWIPKPSAAAFTWRGITFRNRVGVAAGFDKNALCLHGIDRLGAGFVEVGTILTDPWKGNLVSPRMARLVAVRGIWNRLGFTSLGLEVARARLAAFPASRGLVIACNIGPHPGKLKQAADRAQALALARAELTTLITALKPHCQFLVVNLSSPNTPGLRSLLQSSELVDMVLRPCRDAAGSMPLLVKLPPEDENREPWTRSSLEAVVAPMLARDACDGFVAVNTSTRLAQQLVQGIRHPELPGGVSGDPIRPIALAVVETLRSILGPDRLLIGCGGIMVPTHAQAFRTAGADLVEVYSGMIYAGPGLIAACAGSL